MGKRKCCAEQAWNVPFSAPFSAPMSTLSPLATIPLAPVFEPSKLICSASTCVAGLFVIDAPVFVSIK
jgi:hypothetical protein